MVACPAPQDWTRHTKLILEAAYSHQLYRRLSTPIKVVTEYDEPWEFRRHFPTWIPRSRPHLLTFPEGPNLGRVLSDEEADEYWSHEGSKAKDDVAGRIAARRGAGLSMVVVSASQEAGPEGAHGEEEAGDLTPTSPAVRPQEEVNQQPEVPSKVETETESRRGMQEGKDEDKPQPSPSSSSSPTSVPAKAEMLPSLRRPPPRSTGMSDLWGRRQMKAMFNTSDFKKLSVEPASKPTPSAPPAVSCAGGGGGTFFRPPSPHHGME